MNHQASLKLPAINKYDKDTAASETKRHKTFTTTLEICEWHHVYLNCLANPKARGYCFPSLLGRITEWREETHVSQVLSSKYTLSLSPSVHLSPFKKSTPLGKCRRIQGVTNLILQQVHDKDGTAHATVSKAGPTVKTKKAGIGPNPGTRLRKGSGHFTFNVSLHDSLNGVERMRQVASKETTQQSGGDACRGIVGKGLGVRFHQGPSHDRGNGEVSVKK